MRARILVALTPAPLIDPPLGSHIRARRIPSSRQVVSEREQMLLNRSRAARRLSYPGAPSALQSSRRGPGPHPNGRRVPRASSGARGRPPERYPLLSTGCHENQRSRQARRISCTKSAQRQTTPFPPRTERLSTSGSQRLWLTEGRIVPRIVSSIGGIEDRLPRFSCNVVTGIRSWPSAKLLEAWCAVKKAGPRKEAA